MSRTKLPNEFFSEFSPKKLAEVLQYILIEYQECEEYPAETTREELTTEIQSKFDGELFGTRDLSSNEAMDIFAKFSKTRVSYSIAYSIYDVIKFLDSCEVGKFNISNPIPKDYKSALGDTVLYLAKREKQEFWDLLNISQTNPNNKKRWAQYNIIAHSGNPKSTNDLDENVKRALEDELQKYIISSKNDGSGQLVECSFHLIDNNLEYYFFSSSKPAVNERIKEGNNFVNRLTEKTKEVVLIYNRTTLKASICCVAKKERAIFVEKWARIVKDCSTLADTEYGQTYELHHLIFDSDFDFKNVSCDVGLEDASLREVTFYSPIGQLNQYKHPTNSTIPFHEGLMKTVDLNAIEDESWKVLSVKIKVKLNSSKDYDYGRCCEQTIEVTTDSTDIEEKSACVKDALNKLLVDWNINRNEVNNEL